MSDNIILSTDSYKLTHWKMYPPGTRHIGSYFESRSGGEYDHTCFFGLQYILDKYLSGVRVTEQGIDEAEKLCSWHFEQDVFNREGWEYILDKHKGMLPISIRAVPEGTIVPSSNVLFTVENTDYKTPWITNHVETLLVQLWYPCTVATISHSMKQMISDKFELAGGDSKALPYMLHDFGFRGSTSVESSAIGGAAHLINFEGTDNLSAMRLLIKHYGATSPGVSVPAAEHSTITAWGKNGETDAYRHILKTYPDGTISVVSDSWDIINACKNIWGGELKEDLDSNDRRIVIRPDSGDPLSIIPQCLTILGQRFGFTQNDMGYKILPNNIRLLQGDGISRGTISSLMDSIMNAGWSVENVIFGSGGGLLQDCNRDTLKFALKCNWANIKGKEVDVCKRPVTDPGKNSKSGRLKLIASDKGSYETVGIKDDRRDVLQEVFRDGKILKRISLADIRYNVER